MSNRVIYPMLGTGYAPGVVQVDPVTHAPVPCLAALGPLASSSSISVVQAADDVWRTSGLTDTQLRAAAVPVSMAATPGLTDAQLRAAAVPVAGSSAVGTAPSAPPLSVSGVDAGGLKRHLLTDSLGRLQTAPASSATSTTVPCLASSFLVAAANASRKLITILNPTSAGVIFYPSLISPAVAAATAIRVIPPGISIDLYDYTGPIYGICSAATGSLIVTEVM